MPYCKKYKKRYRKRNYRKREPDAIDVARYAASGVKKIFRMINVENKHVDLEVASALVGTTPILYNLAAIPTGDGAEARDGISVKLQTLTCRFQAQPNASATRTTFRMIIFRAKQENDVDITAADLLESTSGNQACLSPKNYEKRFKTKILVDKILALNYNGEGKKIFKIVEKLYGHINYDPAQADGTDVESGGLYMLVVSSDNTNQPNIYFHSRVTYTDN